MRMKLTGKDRVWGLVLTGVVLSYFIWDFQGAGALIMLVVIPTFLLAHSFAVPRIHRSHIISILTVGVGGTIVIGIVYLFGLYGPDIYGSRAWGAAYQWRYYWLSPGQVSNKHTNPKLCDADYFTYQHAKFLVVGQSRTVTVKANHWSEYMYGEPRSLDHETGKIRWIQTDAFCRNQSTKCSSAGEGPNSFSFSDMAMHESAGAFSIGELTLAMQLQITYRIQ